MNKTLLGFLAVAAAVVAILFSSYNGMVSMDENVTGKWAQVENQLQRRSDLVPNLVNTVKGYAAHEKEVFQAVADARSKLSGASTVAETSAADSQMTGALSRLLAIAESYPALQASSSFTQLADELAGTENRIAVARKDYNSAVQAYNAKVKSLPVSLYAGALGFSPRDYFKADEAAQKAPQVKF